MRCLVIGKKGTGGSSSPHVTFNPPGDIYSGNVVLTVAGTNVTKLRYKNGNSDSWHTVAALTTTISVVGSAGGKDVYCDALDASSVVLASGHEIYFKDI